MPTFPDESLKEHCKHLIEEKLGWGSSEFWTNQDFDLLSEKILEATGVNLSQTTLKRIWGKVKYDSAPTVTTLNTLVQFVGFDNWRDFRQKQTPIPDTQVMMEDATGKPEPLVEKQKKSFLIPVLATIIILLTTAAWVVFSSKPNVKLKEQSVAGYQFSSQKMVSLGLPNSVIFEYDASSSPEDSIYIQQSWDNRLRALVPKDQHLHTSIYYYPGFFQAKLLAGNVIVKEHDVFIQTDGWLPLVEQEPVPVYFKKEDAIKGGVLSLSVEKLRSQNLLTKTPVPVVFYANVREFGELKSDSFIFETSVRNDYKDGSGVCQHSEIRLLTEGSMISIPLSAKGCISENNLFCLGHFVKGTDHNLSGFGVDFSHFVKLRVEVTHQHAKFFVDDKLAYQLDGEMPATKLKGIVYRFQGTGSVDWVKLSSSDGKLMYEDEF